MFDVTMGHGECIAGTFRLYFNRRGEKPSSIDRGSIETEMLFDEIECLVPIRSVYKPDETDRENKPCYWFEAHGVLEVEGNKAVLRPHASKLDQP